MSRAHSTKGFRLIERFSMISGDPATVAVTLSYRMVRVS